MQFLTFLPQSYKKLSQWPLGGENHALDLFLDIRGCVAGRIDERLHVRWLYPRPARAGDHRAGIRVYFQTPVTYLALTIDYHWSQR